MAEIILMAEDLGMIVRKIHRERRRGLCANNLVRMIFKRY